MYRLNTVTLQDVLHGDAAAEAEGVIAYAAKILEDSAHGLVFDAEQHRYYLGDRELRSVSAIVESYAPFDSLATAERCAKNKRHEMYGKDPQEIVAIWQRRADEAASAGSDVHEFCEACFLVKTGRADLLEDRYKARLTAEGLEASSPKEEAAARWWNALDMTRFIPVAKETRIVNPRHNYAGTFDLLLWDRMMQGYCIRDWKTNKDLFRWYGDMLRPPLSPIRADDHGKYTLQQNLYRISLENIGLPVISMELEWLRDDASYQSVEIKDYDSLIRFAMDRDNPADIPVPEIPQPINDKLF